MRTFALFPKTNQNRGLVLAAQGAISDACDRIVFLNGPAGDFTLAQGNLTDAFLAALPVGFQILTLEQAQQQSATWYPALKVNP